MLKWPGSIQCSLLMKYMLSLNKNSKLDYFNAVLHGKVMGIYSQSLKKINKLLETTLNQQYCHNRVNKIVLTLNAIYSNSRFSLYSSLANSTTFFFGGISASNFDQSILTVYSSGTQKHFLVNNDECNFVNISGNNGRHRLYTRYLKKLYKIFLHIQWNLTLRSPH